ncbi:unnamed protein product [Medioppia subpectinata]|uniref:Uncharacterized protein n=1 Tax=Medioppia subpectinata TaxID=1979941 RepID=A0A7R9L1W0_9ACAR|nr:unnamed protein product [Medioppia subpectinata]CAG2113965.1 unnamed protein product [Medioppia subpectinata]
MHINVGKFCGEAQRALKDRLQLLQNYVNSMGNTVSANCDWSKIPKPTEKHPKSIQLLMAQALS